MNPRTPTRRAAIATALVSLFASAGARAQFTYAGGTLNSTQTYDGAGVDAALEPRTFGAANQDDYIGNGNGGTGVLTVASGNLTINANDFKIGNGNATANGTINANGGVLTINQIGQWGGGVGQVGKGTLNVVTGATVNWQTSGSSEQRFMVGNGNGGQGFLNLNGGTLSNYFDAGQALTDAERGWRAGSDGGTATINLNAGTWSLNGAVPFFLGGKYNALNGTPGQVQGASVSVMNITHGLFKQTGITIATGLSTTSSTFTIGENDYVNFVIGGNGGLSIQGWDSVTDPGYTKFKALIDVGKIRKDGVIATPGDYTGYLFSDDSGQGVLKIDNSTLAAPTIVTQPASFVDGTVGGSVNITAAASGNPAPALLWERSTDNGGTWTSTGVTTATLTLTGLTYAMDGYRYRLVADNNVEPNATSDESTLFVTYPNPAISAQPVSVGNATAGGSAGFTVTASGVGTLTYQWQKSTDAGNSWSDVSGATAATLAFDPVAHSDVALYRVVVTDPAATAESLPATTTTSNWAYLGLANNSAGFVWAPVNSTMTYDGAGADSAINPYTQFGNDIAIGLGNGSSSELTVSSGTLSIFNVDQWSLKIGQNHVSGHTGTGVVNVSTGATLNLGDTGAGGAIASNEQRVVIGARANGALNVNGGTVNIHVGPGSDASRSFMIGGSGDAGYTGSLNLNSGTLNHASDAVIRIGTGAGAGVININDGQLRATGTSTLLFGGNDFINFTIGGTGSIAILGWDSVADPGYTKFKALIDAGVIRANGVVVPAGSYDAAVFSDDGDLGVMKINPAYVASPYLVWANANAGGQGADLDHDGDGVTNGIEFFLNATAGFTANPQVSGGSVTWPNSGNIASAEYGTQFKVQTSDSLSGWTDVPASDPGLSNTAGSVSYTLPTGAGILFVRLMVTPN